MTKQFTTRLNDLLVVIRSDIVKIAVEFFAEIDSQTRVLPKAGLIGCT